MPRRGGRPQLRQDWSEAQKLGLLTNEILKKQIFPNLHNWPELVVASLEDIGVERKASVTMVMEWLIGQGRGEPGHNCRLSRVGGRAEHWAYRADTGGH